MPDVDELAWYVGVSAACTKDRIMAPGSGGSTWATFSLASARMLLPSQFMLALAQLQLSLYLSRLMPARKLNKQSMTVDVDQLELSLTLFPCVNELVL
eukprot:611290-Pelagomonas_calceolata.AAC.2